MPVRLFFSVHSFILRERERERESREGQRERAREDLKQALHCEHRVQCTGLDCTNCEIMT